MFVGHTMAAVRLARVVRIGLSGGIGSGKSTVARLLADRGAVVIDADRVAREVVEPHSIGLERVRARFGGAVIAPDGTLDRPALGRVVFDDPCARMDLEGILHPLIAARTAELFGEAPREAVVVHDIPLLVELDRSSDYHLTIIVGASEQVRHARLVRDRGMDPGDAWARIRAQADDTRRRAAADVWMVNEGSPEQLAESADACWRERIVPFNHNVLTGAIAHPQAPVIQPYDPTWPAQAARLIGRIRTVLGDRAVDVEHVGPTSVPGTAAADVIDLQVGVRALADRDDPGFVKALADQGFPRVDDDRVPAGASPQLERVHGSADPGRAVRVHVREVGSAR